MRLWTLQAVIVAAVVLACFAVGGIGTPKRIREMCAAETHKDAVSRQVCRDFSAV